MKHDPDYPYYHKLKDISNQISSEICTQVVYGHQPWNNPYICIWADKGPEYEDFDPYIHSLPSPA